MSSRTEEVAPPFDTSETHNYHIVSKRSRRLSYHIIVRMINMRNLTIIAVVEGKLPTASRWLSPIQERQGAAEQEVCGLWQSEL